MICWDMSPVYLKGCDEIKIIRLLLTSFTGNYHQAFASFTLAHMAECEC